MATNDDAAQAKAYVPRPLAFAPWDRAWRLTSSFACARRAAVNKGYFEDALLPTFVRNMSGIRRPPLLNRGTWVRVGAIRALVLEFIEQADTLAGGVRLGPDGAVACQVVSVGAGSDTLALHLLGSSSHCPALCLELDLGPVVARKAALMRRAPAVHALLARGAHADVHGDEPVRLSSAGVSAPRYCLAECDLRQSGAFAELLASSGLDASLPTLLLSELVLVYMPVEDSAATITAFARRFAHSAVVLYEQVEPDDAFGAMMLANIEARGCALRSVRDFPTLEAQRQRFLSLGFERAEARTMLDAAADASAEQTARADALERLDELEEWRLLLSHYAVVCASRGDVRLTFPARLRHAIPQ